MIQSSPALLLHPPPALQHCSTATEGPPPLQRSSLLPCDLPAGLWAEQMSFPLLRGVFGFWGVSELGSSACSSSFHLLQDAVMPLVVFPRLLLFPRPFCISTSSPARKEQPCGFQVVPPPSLGIALLTLLMAGRGLQ